MKPERSAILATGAIAGLIGSAVVALLFVILNLIRGEPALDTAAALGSAVFRIPPADIVPAAIAFNGAHVLAAVAAGIGASFLMTEMEVHPAAWYLAFLVYLIALLVGFVLIGVLAVDVVGVASWVEIVAVNLVAAVSMGAYIWKAHPRLKQALRRAPD